MNDISMYPNRRRKKESTILPVGIIWCFALFAFGMGLLADLALLGVYTMAMTLAFMISPRIGLPAFVMVLPFELHLAETMPISAFVTLMPGMIVGYLVYCMRVGRKAPFERGGIILGGALIAAALLSFASSDLPPQYRMFVSLCLMIAIFLVCASIMKHEREGLFFIGHGLIAASVIGGVGGFLYIGSSDYEVVQEIGTGGRLAIGGNVRAVANVVGLGLFILIASALLKRRDFFYHEQGERMFPLENNITLRAFFILLLGFFLAATAMRGMIVALAGGLFAVIVVSMLFSGDRRNRFQLSIWALPIIGIVIYSVMVLTLTYIDPEILGGQFALRMERLIYEPLSDPRVAIWMGTLGQLVGKEWFFGTGLGTFRWMAAQAGFFFYAHSVFVDLLVEMGVVALFSMLGFLGLVFHKFYKQKNVFGIGLLVFLILSFSTHGSSSSKAFWITLGLVYGLALAASFGSNLPKRAQQRPMSRPPYGTSPSRMKAVAGQQVGDH